MHQDSLKMCLTTGPELNKGAVMFFGLRKKSTLWNNFNTFQQIAVPLSLLMISNVAYANESDLAAMSIEDLMDIQVTSVSKKPQSLSNSAAAIFVITEDDIKQSASTSIPELLRMVPGLSVARIDANKWAISSRGFNSRFADKLLVLIDGRSVYNPLYSGVYWNAQDTVLEDIERIEVIRGPGATVWGSNAVNGVISIITKHAADTLGGLVSGGVGTKERAFATGRYGATIADGIYGRFYAKGNNRDSSDLVSGQDAGDAWTTYRSGFRIDGTLSSANSFTVQGDIYSNDIDLSSVVADLAPPYMVFDKSGAKSSGGNIQLAWTRYLAGNSELNIQLYYDRTNRKEIVEEEETDTLDFELKHHFSLGLEHDIVWGMHYRFINDQLHNNFHLTVEPERAELNLFSFFVQDEYSIIDDELFLTVGSKFEHNDYTGYEIQPSARILWNPEDEHIVWGAVSRAVRTPSRIEHNSTINLLVAPPSSQRNPLPVPFLWGLKGNEKIDSQVLIAYEAGYRFIPTAALSLDAAIFYNDYDKLRTAPAEHSFNGLYANMYGRFSNGEEGDTHGLELAVAWQPLSSLKIDLAYSLIFEDLPDTRDLVTSEAPTNQLSLMANWQLTDTLAFDFWGKYVDKIRVLYAPSVDYSYQIDDYFTVDLQVTYTPFQDLELAVVGQNLLEKNHEEFVQEFYTLPGTVARSVYMKATYRF